MTIKMVKKWTRWVWDLKNENESSQTESDFQLNEMERISRKFALRWLGTIVSSSFSMFYSWLESSSSEIRRNKYSAQGWR